MIKPIIQAFLIMVFVICANETKAQQAKAYEVVKYAAKSGKILFHLDYADGYIGASKIKVVETGHKTVIFTPVSGATEEDGSFVFRSSTGTKKSQIKLINISEATEAPAIIRGIYQLNTNKMGLVFNRSSF